MVTTTKKPTVVPAQLDFLAIYNPSLGTTDETLDQQIVYFCKSPALARGATSSGRPKKATDVTHEEKNERLRQIGLAQGMVEFANSFSDGKAVDSIETEKCRVVLHELEAGWWILVSVSLTQLLSASTETKTVAGIEGHTQSIEYSSREVKPARLLLADLLRAHSTFLIHHASSISALFVRTQRAKFVDLLGRYWDSFLPTWNIMLHGNPAITLYNGIKLASSGELGMGVGEEERGSGERDVLEGFVGRIDGLIDLVVSKFGTDTSDIVDEDAPSSISHATPSQPWLGSGSEPSIEDGAIFLGTGALSRHSLRDITQWMEDIYSWGPHAYGVLKNPSSNRRERKKYRSAQKPSRGTPRPGKDSDHISTTQSTAGESSHSQRASSGLRKSPLRNVYTRVASSDNKVNQETNGDAQAIASNEESSSTTRTALHHEESSKSSEESYKDVSGASSRLVSFLKMGYGTHWSLGGSTEKDESTNGQETSLDSRSIPRPVTELVPQHSSSIPAMSDETQPADNISTTPKDEVAGHFLIGLLGSLADEAENENDHSDVDEEDEDAPERRMVLRTVTLELERAEDVRKEEDISIDLGNDTRQDSKPASSQHTQSAASYSSYDSQDRNKTARLQVVVYVRKPFIYTFLFKLRTHNLMYAELYRLLHQQLGPLQRPLLSSTKHTLSRPAAATTTAEALTTPIYDLVWDPKALTIHSTIPGIPDPALPRYENDKNWSRIEALNTHTHILSTIISTRGDRTQLEKTCKTSRGWWVVWQRILDVENEKSVSPLSSTVANTDRSNGASSTAAKSKFGRREESTGDISTNTDTTGTVSTTHESAYSEAHPFMDDDKEVVLKPLDKEIFLLRQASDHVAIQSMPGRIVSGSAGYMGLSGEGWGSSAVGLVNGIGIDTKRYVEGLLSMGR